MDSKIAENIVIYDWLSFTSKFHSPDDLIAALGLSHVPWTITKGARGYQDRKYFSCISIHYNGRADMGVWVECPARAAALLKVYPLLVGMVFFLLFSSTV